MRAFTARECTIGRPRRRPRYAAHRRPRRDAWYREPWATKVYRDVDSSADQRGAFQQPVPRDMQSKCTSPLIRSLFAFGSFSNVSRASMDLSRFLRQPVKSRKPYACGHRRRTVSKPLNVYPAGHDAPPIGERASTSKSSPTLVS